jgi:hypothetical protein
MAEAHEERKRDQLAGHVKGVIGQINGLSLVLTNVYKISKLITMLPIMKGGFIPAKGLTGKMGTCPRHEG